MRKLCAWKKISNLELQTREMIIWSPEDAEWLQKSWNGANGKLLCLLEWWGSHAFGTSTEAPGIVNWNWIEKYFYSLASSSPPFGMFDFCIWGNCPTMHRFLKFLSWKNTNCGISAAGFPQKRFLYPSFYPSFLTFCPKFSQHNFFLWKIPIVQNSSMGMISDLLNFLWFWSSAHEFWM